MLNIFDLFDLHAVLVNIRNDPACSCNEEIVKSLISAMKDASSSSYNSFRREINHNCPKLSDEYAFVRVENAYPFVPLLLKDRKKQALLLYCLSYLLDVLREKNFEKIFDTADALHNLPLFLIQEGDWRSFWKSNVVPYRKKWDESFLESFKK